MKPASAAADVDLRGFLAEARAAGVVLEIPLGLTERVDVAAPPEMVERWSQRARIYARGLHAFAAELVARSNREAEVVGGWWAFGYNAPGGGFTAVLAVRSASIEERARWAATLLRRPGAMALRRAERDQLAEVLEALVVRSLAPARRVA